MAIGRLTVDIESDITKLTKGVKASNKLIKGFSNKFTKSMDRMKSSANSLKLAVAGIGTAMATSSFSSHIDSTTKKITLMTNEAERLGLSLAEVQLLEGLGDRVGIELDTMLNNVNDMKTRLGDAFKGGGTAKQSLKDLGLDVGKVVNMKTIDQVLLLSEALSKVDEKTRHFQVEENFTEESFVSAFKGGTDAVIKYGGEISKLGLITVESSEQYVKLNNEISLFKKTLGIVSTQLIGQLIPSMKAFLMQFTSQEAIDSMIDKINLFSQELKRPIYILKSLGSIIGLVFSSSRLVVLKFVDGVEKLIHRVVLIFNKYQIMLVKLKSKISSIGTNIGNTFNKVGFALGISEYKENRVYDATKDISELKKLKREAKSLQNFFSNQETDTVNITKQINNDFTNKIKELIDNSTKAFQSDVLDANSPIVKSGQVKPEELIKKGSIKKIDLGLKKDNNFFDYLKDVRKRYDKAKKSITQDEKDEKNKLKLKVELDKDSVEKTTKLLEEYTSLWQSSLDTVFDNLIETGKVTQDVIRGILMDITKEMTRMYITKPASQALGAVTASAAAGIGDFVSSAIGLQKQSIPVTVNNYGNDNVNVQQTNNGVDIVIGQIVDDISRGTGSIGNAIEERYGIRKV